MAQDHATLLLDPGRDGDRVRGHRRQVHRRRDHGRLRGAGRPRGPRAARLLRGAADARRRRRLRGRAAARAAASTSPTRIGINSGEVVAGAIGAGRRRRLHRDRPHGRPGAADGGAGRARQGLRHRAHCRARGRVSRPHGPRRVRDQGRQPPRPGLRAGRSRSGALPARPLPRARLLQLRRQRPRRWRR